MINKDIELYLFDMGNTLLHFHSGLSDEEKDEIGLWRLQRAIESLYNKEIPMNILKEQFLIPINNYLKYQRKKLGVDLDIGQVLSNILKLTPSSEEVITLSKAFYYQYEKDMVMEPGVAQLLKVIKNKGNKIGIVSNCFLPDQVYMDIFKSLRLDDFIDAYFFSYSNKCMKPNSELFKKALTYFNTEPHKVVMIGDNLDCDILSTIQLGMSAVLFDKKNRHPDYKGNKITDLSILKEHIS